MDGQVSIHINAQALVAIIERAAEKALSDRRTEALTEGANKGGPASASSRWPCSPDAVAGGVISKELASVDLAVTGASELHGAHTTQLDPGGASSCN
jgi:hypothetical protein